MSAGGCFFQGCVAAWPPTSIYHRRIEYVKMQLHTPWAFKMWCSWRAGSSTFDIFFFYLLSLIILADVNHHCSNWRDFFFPSRLCLFEDCFSYATSCFSHCVVSIGSCEVSTAVTSDLNCGEALIEAWSVTMTVCGGFTNSFKEMTTPSSKPHNKNHSSLSYYTLCSLFNLAQHL